MSDSTWPADWDDRAADHDCPLCATRGVEDTGYGVRIMDGQYVDAYLNRAELRGYAMVIWSGKHVSEPTHLPREQAAGFFAEMLSVGQAVEDHFQPVKMNYEILGNAVPHLHAHVIPRHHDDPAPGAPIPSALLRRSDTVDGQFDLDAKALREMLGYGSAQP